MHTATRRGLNRAFQGLMTNAHSQPPSRTRPPRILIVEDDLVIALMIEEFVREFGNYAVSSVAGTVAMARLQIAQRNFDAVLLDINMEGAYQPETADFTGSRYPVRLRDRIRLSHRGK